MDWFRHYNGCAFDPKWRTVARRTKTTIERVLFVWDSLMEFASEREGDERGSVEGWNPEIVADHLMCDLEDIRNVRNEIEQVGCIVENRLTAWIKRQHPDPTAADRMRRYRARKNGEAPKGAADFPEESKALNRNKRNVTANVTRNKPPESVTRYGRVEQSRTEQKGTPTSAVETLTVPKESCGGETRARARARTAPASRSLAPQDLILDDELIAIAEAEGRDAERELERFRDHCEANGRAYKDYRAAFRNWLRTSYGKANGHDVWLKDARERFLASDLPG